MIEFSFRVVLKYKGDAQAYNIDEKNLDELHDRLAKCLEQVLTYELTATDEVEVEPI